jgi:outer membrane protein, heavy metal efflux system
MEMRLFRVRTVSAMRPGRWFLVVLPCLLLPAVAARSEPAPSAPPSRAEVPSDTLSVSWQELVDLADRHPRLLASRAGLSAARGAAADAGAIPNPSLEATVTRPEGGRVGGAPREWSLELGFPIDWVVRRGSKVAAADALVEAGAAEVRVTRLEVLLQLRELFLNLACDQARVAALQALQSQTAELVRSVGRRVEKGEARPTDAARVEIELEKVASDLDAVRASLRARQGQLRLWLVPGARGAVAARMDLAAVPGVPDVDSALARAASGHPSLAASAARVQSLDAELGIEKWGRLPGVGVKVFRLAEPDRRAYGAGVALDVPIWNWNSGRVSQARAQLEAGRRRLDAERLDIESAVIEAHGNCLATSGTASRYRDRILPRSESTAAIMERAYQLGEASLFDVIDARRVLVGTHLEYLAALVQAHLASSRLNALIGWEDAQ